MSYDGVKEALKGGPARKPGRLGATATLVLLLAFSIAAGAAILTIPRPVAPTEMPALVLTDAELGRVRARDAERAREASHDADADALRERYAEYSRAEVEGGQTLAAARRMMGDLTLAARAYREARGDDALLALRAEATERAESALAGELPDAERDAVLGTFEDVLDRHGVPEGAHPLVVRTLFVSRWNAAHGLPPSLGMDRAELRAYWGYLALEAEDAPIPRRLQALAKYAEAGGDRVAEARGTLLFRAEQPIPAAEAFEQAYEEEGSLRLRNHALAAFAAGAAEQP